jgi:hypothetical protein
MTAMPPDFSPAASPWAVFDVSGWDAGERSALGRLLDTSAIPWEMRGDALMTPRRYEAAVNTIFATVDATTVEYDLTEWLDSDLSRLVGLLRSSGIDWTLRGNVLMVPSEWEAVVDETFDALCSEETDVAEDDTVDSLGSEDDGPSGGAAASYGIPWAPPGYVPVGYGYGFPSAPTHDGLAVTSMVLGILSPFLVFLCLLGAVTGPLAIVLGLVSLSNIKKSAGRLRGKGMARAGVACGAAALVMALLYVGVLLVAMSGDESDL